MKRIRPQPVDERKDVAVRLELDDIQQKIRDMLDLAKVIESPDFTSGDVRRGVVMALRGVARIAAYLAKTR